MKTSISISFTAFFFFSFISQYLCRPIGLDSVAATAEKDWFHHHHHHHHHSWGWAHSPMPANWPKKHWPFAESPKPSSGSKWYWPKPGHKWAYADGPMAHGSWKWHHHGWKFAHSPFPCPWWQKKNSKVADDVADQVGV